MSDNAISSRIAVALFNRVLMRFVHVPLSELHVPPPAIQQRSLSCLHGIAQCYDCRQ